MSSHQAATVEWHFTRPDPPRSSVPYFREDLRKIAGMQADYNLPWQDDLYLTYPSASNPDWTAFIAHVKQLNAEAAANQSYKIFYIIRRAHKESVGDQIDPSIDATGHKQCLELAGNLSLAMRDTQLPSPELIVTSPLTRAMETTKLSLTPLFPSLHPIIHENLREQLNGVEKNKRHVKKCISQRYPFFDTSNVDADNTLETIYANTKEPYQDLWQRVKGVFEYIFETFPEEALVIALISHCYVVKTIQREITGYDIREEERTGAVEFFIGEGGIYAIIVKGEKRRMLRE